MTRLCGISSKAELQFNFSERVFGLQNCLFFAFYPNDSVEI